MRRSKFPAGSSPEPSPANLGMHKRSTSRSIIDLMWTDIAPVDSGVGCGTVEGYNEGVDGMNNR